MQEFKTWVQVNKKTLLKIFVGIGACILLYWLFSPDNGVSKVLDFAVNMISPFAVGATIAFVLNVPMRAIETKLLHKIKFVKFRRLLALTLTFIAFLLVLALVFVLLIPAIIDTIQEFWAQLQVSYDGAQSWVSKLLVDYPEVTNWINTNLSLLENLNWQSIGEKAGNLLSSILNGTVSVISVVVDGVFDMIISVVFAIYCLFQKEILASQGRKMLYAFTAEKTADRVVRVMRLTNTAFSRFLSGQCIEVCILGCMVAISMMIFRMPYIPLVSVLAAVTAFIPMVGAFVGCAVGAILILVKDPVLALVFVAMFIVVQQIEGNLIYPKVVGESIGISGMWVLVAVGVGGELFGVVGMFLMVPLASVIYTLLHEATHKRLRRSKVPAYKLEAQPVVIRSKLKGKKKRRKEAQEVATDAKPDEAPSQDDHTAETENQE